MINVRIKNKEFTDRVILSDIEYQFKTGIYILQGENGAGKSTLLNMIYKLDGDYQGQILFNNTDINDIDTSDYRTNYVNYILQSENLFTYLTVDQNIEMLTNNVDQTYVQELKTGFKIQELSKKKFGKLSGGEKQKVRIIIGLLGSAPVLLMDEPDNNLDDNAIKFLSTVIEQSNKTLIIVSHNEYFNYDEVEKIKLGDEQISNNETEITLHIGDNKLSLTKKIKQKLVKKTAKYRVISYLLISLLTLVMLYNCLVYLDSVTMIGRLNSADYCDTCMTIAPPFNNQLIYSFGDKSWLKTDPYYFTAEDKALLEQQPEVASVTPIAFSGATTASTSYQRKYDFNEIIDLSQLDYQKYNIEQPENNEINLQYKRLIDPKVVNEKLPLNKMSGVQIEAILYGDLPDDNSQEIMIEQNLAVYYAQLYDLDSLDQLIGMDVVINATDIETGTVVPLTFTVSGIYDGLAEVNGKSDIIFPYEQGGFEDLANHPWLGIDPHGDSNPYEYFLYDFHGAYDLVGATYPTKEDIEPLKDNAYPSFLIETNTAEDIETLTKKIQNYDKYIAIDNNYVRLHSSNLIYLRRFLIKKTIEIIVLIALIVASIIMTFKLNKNAVDKIILELRFFGFSDEEIDKYNSSQNSLLISGITLCLVMILIVGLIFSNFNILPGLIIFTILVIIFLLSYFINKRRR